MTNARPFPTDEEVANGLHLCFRNADALRTEAKILYDAEHKARAFSLLVLSLEELGKIPLLFSALSLRRTPGSDPKPFWRQLAQHQPKQEIWAYYGCILEAAGDPRASSFTKRLPDNIGRVLDVAKQKCFYTDSGNGQFEDPEVFIHANPDLWPWLMEIVDSRLESFREIHGHLSLSQRMVADFVRLSNPLARTQDDIQRLARRKDLGLPDFAEHWPTEPSKDEFVVHNPKLLPDNIDEHRKGRGL
jgi:AbiV family abortive infection protein